jgi:hypothetical protein
VLDGIGSVVWGNALASDVKLGFSVVVPNLSFLLENQLTSCIASQAVITLHFAYVSCRSRRGRGWAYASLRFELDECGRSMSLQDAAAMTEGRRESGGQASAAAPLIASDSSARADMQRAGAGVCSVFAGLRQRWAQFQQRQVARCRVFVIPCVATRGAEEGGKAGIALARLALELKWLRPLQLLADAHPRLFWCFEFLFLAAPSFLFVIFYSSQSAVRGITTSVCILFGIVTTLGFLSSRRYGLDRVAAKHVVLSFRFAVLVALLATNVALNARSVYSAGNHPAVVVANSLSNIIFCLCVLLECIPHLPPSVQTFVSVMARNAVRATVYSSLLQVTWCTYYGWMTFVYFQSVSNDAYRDCFVDLGAYQICDATQRLSISSSLFLLMLQALISRMAVPGISNFVNASVRRKRQRVSA